MARLRAPVATVEMALNARHEGLGVRAAARVVGTSPSNITTWEERLSSHLAAWSPPAPEGGEVTIEGDELYTRVGENRIPSGKASPTAELTTKPSPPKPRRAGPLVSLNARVALNQRFVEPMDIDAAVVQPATHPSLLALGLVPTAGQVGQPASTDR
jgi:hypothetical protein